jgi:hypothetical protein
MVVPFPDQHFVDTVAASKKTADHKRPNHSKTLLLSTAGAFPTFAN